METPAAHSGPGNCACPPTDRRPVCKEHGAQNFRRREEGSSRYRAWSVALARKRNNRQPKTFHETLLSLLGSLVIALLPKCYFCLLAYSSAITLCSGATVYDHQPGWFSFVSIALGLVVAGSIFRNYRGPRSGWALALALAGLGVVAYSELMTGQRAHYQTGAWLLLSGALLNGGLPVVLRSRGRGIGRYLAATFFRKMPGI